MKLTETESHDGGLIASLSNRQAEDRSVHVPLTFFIFTVLILVFNTFASQRLVFDEKN